jgi:molybdopterin converting factor subunit 1
MLFGAAADRAGRRELDLDTGATTIGELWPLLTELHPGLEPMRDTLAFAVNEEYAQFDARVEPGDEVAVLPPVSGG